MPLRLSSFQVPVGWGEILRRTFKDAFYKDNVLGMSAQLAYYFFFALFPTLLVLLSLASFFNVARLRDDMIALLSGVAPAEVIQIISEQMAKISSGEQGGLLTIGLLTALWSSSAAMTAIIDTLNTAYDIEEGRPWWTVRLVAISLTIGVALFIMLSVSLVMLGPSVAEMIAANTALSTAFVWTWTILQWPLVFAIVALGIGLIYYFAPDAEQEWVWITPGAVMATVLWLIATIGFKFYVASMGNYTESYGFIGGVMVLMLWFYISALVILAGAEMNAEIEHASPYGKDVGEKVPGQKKKIGVAAMRAWTAQRGHMSPATTREPMQPITRTPAAPALAPAQASAGVGTWLLGTGIAITQAWMTLGSYLRRRTRT